MLRILPFILILILNPNISNLHAQQIDYSKATDLQLEEALGDDTKLDAICKTSGIQIARIDDFSVYDISKEYFLVSVYSPCNRDNFINELKEASPSLYLMMGFRIIKEDKNIDYPSFQDTAMEISKDSLQKDPKNAKYISFLAKHPFKVLTSFFPEHKSKKKTDDSKNAQTPAYDGHFFYPVYLESNSKEINLKLNSAFRFDMQDRLISKNKQPELIQMTPNGGIPGSTVTVIGKYFGDDLDKILIEVSKYSEPDIIYSYDINPFYLGETDDEKKLQVIKFSIPEFSSTQSLLERSSFFNTRFRVRIIVKARPSDYQNLSIVPTSWKWQIISLSNLMVFFLLCLIAIIMKKINFIPSLLLDKATNTYSLSKLQAFLWTLVIIGGYFYLAIAHALLLRDGTIPKFNESLIALMSISFGGLIGSGAIGLKKVKNEIIATPPSFSDFFSQGGLIDLPRLQLFLFTITSILIYMYTIFTFDSMENLPDIPPSLLGLMGVSQGGYIGGKMMGGKVAINFVSPNELKIGEKKTITILGSGFEPESKILFEGFDVIQSEFLNQNSLTCVLPEFTEEGEKTLILVPPTGNITHFENAVKVKGRISESELIKSIKENIEDINENIEDIKENMEIQKEEKAKEGKIAKLTKPKKEGI